MSSKKKSTRKAESSDDSDVELSGVETSDDEMEETTSQEEDYPEYDEAAHEKSDVAGEDVAAEEVKMYQEAQRERQELMAAEKMALEKRLKSSKGDEEDVKQHRLQYLLAQSEVFAHFLAGSVAADDKKAVKGKKGGRKKGRMSEAAEDAALMKTAQSKRQVTRLQKQPGNLSDMCKMHPYQLEGLNWLIKLHDNGINGILADEMGLGKTLQTISLLAYLRESRGIRGPHIVIVPKSVVGNWMKEFKKWCPQIKAIKMLGTKEERKRVTTVELPPDAKTGKHRFDVLITSYEGVLKEKSSISKVQWRYLIIDEAHRIKNENSSLSKCVRLFETQFRVLITGTPLQNNLHELWALLNFLLPDIFGDAEQFDEWFSLSSGEGHDNVIRKLHTVLRPFMLRRVKKDVACALPPKKETKLFVGLTDMQQKWYTQILRKDAHELNALGGPDKVRLLNILMQLRKVCNHPYLFDGAEPGPPYSDGPHLWEASGKMKLLHNLLIKLKERGSRVLIFSQMTRVLDILEDYMRFVGYEYCRIDGNTDGDVRDESMEAFNAPNSSKFCFLLSTRAGGLGINLATADIVILYDSDWNPQVDLQAMDRAHRIGQTKPVQVFRFIAEGTVEEKIIERADRKLFLDAAVIQQGRLAEQLGVVDKKELMHMVRFGADQILNAKGGTYTDEDIDALIAKGEERTESMNAKIKTDAQHNLATFSLMGEEETNMMTFQGEDYSKKSNQGNFINLPQRERKRNYDMDEYYRGALNEGPRPNDAGPRKRKKGPSMQDFQFYDKERIEELLQIETDLSQKRQDRINEIKAIKTRAKTAPSINNTRANVEPGHSCEELTQKASDLEATLSEFDVSSEHISEKESLLKNAFPDWSKKDFKCFCTSLEKRGRFDVNNIVKDVSRECGKEEAEVKRYFIAFWTNYQRISDWKKIIERVERGEKRISRMREIRDLIQDKVERHVEKVMGTDALEGIATNKGILDQVWQTMTFNYGPGLKGRAYTEEEDAFLVCMMQRHGYGASERIRMEIRRAWQFRFDWFFKSRNSIEIQKRCDGIIKVLERENEIIEQREAKMENTTSNGADTKMVDDSNTKVAEQVA